jgi:hypothetical protein
MNTALVLHLLIKFFMQTDHESLLADVHAIHFLVEQALAWQLC